MADPAQQTNTQVIEKNTDVEREELFPDMPAMDEKMIEAARQQRYREHSQHLNDGMRDDYRVYEKPDTGLDILNKKGNGNIGLAPEELLELRAARMEKSPTVISNKINQYINNYNSAEKAKDTTEQISIAQTLKFYLENTNHNGRHTGDGLQQASLKWEAGKKDFEDNIKKILDFHDAQENKLHKPKEKNDSAGSGSSYERLVEKQLKEAMPRRNENLNFHLATLPVLENYIKAGNDREAVQRILECSRTVLEDPHKRKDLISGLSINKDQLPKGMKDIMGILESDSQSSSIQLKAKILAAVVANGADAGLSDLEKQRIIPALVSGVTKEERAAYWQTFMESAGQKANIEKEGDFSQATDHLSKCMRAIGQEPLYGKVAAIINRQGTNLDLSEPLMKITDQEVLARLLKKVVATNDKESAEMVVLALALTENPGDLLKNIKGDDQQLLKLENDPNIGKIMQAAKEDDSLKVKAEAIEWAIKQDSAQVFRAIVQGIKTDYAPDLDAEHIKIMKRDAVGNVAPYIANLEKQGGYIDYKEILRLRFAQFSENEVDEKIKDFTGK